MASAENWDLMYKVCMLKSVRYAPFHAQVQTEITLEMCGVPCQICGCVRTFLVLELLVTFSGDTGKLLIMSKRVFLRVMCAKKER